MWQRIQTLYMILVIGLMIASIILPNVEFFDSAKNITYQLDGRGLLKMDNQGFAVQTIAVNPTTYLFGIILFLSTFVIMKYKNRKQQFRLATVNLILIFIEILITAGFIVYAKYQLNIDFALKYSAIFPVIALIFNYLAMRGIMKDEKLIKSMDRLR